MRFICYNLLGALVSMTIVGSVGGICTILPRTAPADGSAIVDGDLDEWDLTYNGPDWFAEMHRAFSCINVYQGNAFVRYDCDSSTVYVAVVSFPDYPILASATYDDMNWVKIKADNINPNNPGNTVVSPPDGNDGNPATAPDWSWVGLSPDGQYADGYEASFEIDPNPTTFPVTYYITIHAEISSGGDQTSATAPRNLPITFTCPASPVPRIHVEKYVSVDEGATWFTADNPNGPVAIPGEEVQFKFIVMNIGTETLSPVTLTDDTYFTELAAAMVVQDLPPSILAPGESFAVTIPGITALEGHHANLATTNGIGIISEDEVSDTDPAHYYDGVIIVSEFPSPLLSLITVIGLLFTVVAMRRVK